MVDHGELLEKMLEKMVNPFLLVDDGEKSDFDGEMVTWRFITVNSWSALMVNLMAIVNSCWSIKYQWLRIELRIVDMLMIQGWWLSLGDHGYEWSFLSAVITPGLRGQKGWGVEGEIRWVKACHGCEWCTKCVAKCSMFIVSAGIGSWTPSTPMAIETAGAELE